MSVGRAVLITVGMALAVLTASRVSTWRDERTLWADAVHQAPEKPRPWVNLGRAYSVTLQDEQARAAYRTGILAAAQPSRSLDERVVQRSYAEANLAILDLDAGQPDEAVHLIDRARTRVSDPAIAKVHAWIHASAP